MRSTLISVCAIVACLLMCGCARQQQDNARALKALSWNVWHGGHSKEYPGRGCEGIVGTLRQSEADAIMMVETYGAAPAVSDSLGYPYHLIFGNLSVYSRYPIVGLSSHRDRPGWPVPFLSAILSAHRHAVGRRMGGACGCGPATRGDAHRLGEILPKELTYSTARHFHLHGG